MVCFAFWLGCFRGGERWVEKKRRKNERICCKEGLQHGRSLTVESRWQILILAGEDLYGCNDASKERSSGEGGGFASRTLYTRPLMFEQQHDQDWKSDTDARTHACVLASNTGQVLEGEARKRRRFSSWKRSQRFFLVFFISNISFGGGFLPSERARESVCGRFSLLRSFWILGFGYLLLSLLSVLSFYGSVRMGSAEVLPLFVCCTCHGVLFCSVWVIEFFYSSIFFFIFYCFLFFSSIHFAVICLHALLALIRMTVDNTR